MKLSKIVVRKNSELRICSKIFLTIFAAVSSILALAQEIGSHKALSARLRGRSLCQTFHKIGYELVDVHPDSALRYSEKSIQCAHQFGDTLQEVRGVILQAMAFRRLGELDSSNRVIHSIIPIVRRKAYVNELQLLLHGLGIAYLYKAEFDESLKYNLEALSIRIKHGTVLEQATTLFNIGFTYYKLADYEKSLEYYERSLAAYNKVNAQGGDVTILQINMALSYAYSLQDSLAIKYVENALKQCSPNCPDAVVQHASFCQGVVALNTADTVSAKKYFLTSYAKALKVGDERLQLDNIVYISRLYLATGHLDEAEHYLLLAESLLQKGIPYSMEQMKIYIEFAELFERKGDFRKVAEFQRRHMALKDSIYDDDVTTKLMRLEAERVEKEKNAEIETQNEFLRLNEKILQRQRIATFLGFSTALLFVGMVFVQVRRLRERKRKNADLEHRVKARTQELEVIVHNSHKAVAENRMWMDKILRSVRHATHTVNGLSTLAGIDDESRDKCIQLIDHEMAQLLLQVSDYAGKSETTEDI